MPTQTDGRANLANREEDIGISAYADGGRRNFGATDQTQLKSAPAGSTLNGMDSNDSVSPSKFPAPLRISVPGALALMHEFLAKQKGKARQVAAWGALLDCMAIHFGLFTKVRRSRLDNRSHHRDPNAADLECVNGDGAIVLAVEVKDRALKLADVEGTITKTRHREIREVFFTAPKVEPAEAAQIDSRIETAFAGGQNLYVADFFDLARAVLALGGEKIRKDFLRRVGEHLDAYNTQPSHRQAWKRLLESI